MRDYKLVVLGAGGVGKSCLTVQFVQGVYLDTYDPTIEDSYRKNIEIDNKVFDLEILDTAGVAQFTAMRELYIKSGMGFLLVYSVTDKQSLDELLELREQVLKIKDSNRVPMVLVGNKADLKNERVISIEDGIEVSSRWGKVPFYETSALLRSNVDEVFIDLVRQIIRDEIESVSNNNQNNKKKANLQSLKMSVDNSANSLISTPGSSHSRIASYSNTNANPHSKTVSRQLSSNIQNVSRTPTLQNSSTKLAQQRFNEAQHQQQASQQKQSQPQQKQRQGNSSGSQNNKMGSSTNGNNTNDTQQKKKKKRSHCIIL